MLTGSTAADFLTLTEACQLLPADRLAPYWRLQPTTASAAPVAGRLVRDGLLTNFQARVLLKGRPQNFFLTAKYKILDHLGTGGMGRVYLCEHLMLHRLVAVKVLGLRPAAGGGTPTQGVIERFYREAQAVAALDHKNIARVFDVDQARGSPFMVMEYVDGVDLHKYVGAHGPLEPSRAADYARQAAEGLQHAHEAGLVHRDIKPSNLLLDRSGVVRLLDLGLARFLVDSRRNQGVTERYDQHTILGTADFMAPEQAVDSSGVDIRADIYSLGCTLYFLLTGRLVFDADVVTRKMMAHQMQRPDPIRRHSPGVPEGLEAVAFRMMEKKPADRFPTPEEVAAALRPFATPPPGPPETKVMPKVAAQSFRLGLCPPPGPTTSTGSTPQITLDRAGPPSHATNPALPRSTAARSGVGANADSGPISVGPVSESGRDTPTGRSETLRSETGRSARPAQSPSPQRRSRKWVAPALGGVAVVAAGFAAVFFLLGDSSPANTQPPRANRNGAEPPPQPGANPSPNPAPPVDLATTFSGGGSSFVRPIMDHWTELYKSKGVRVKYAGVGSSKGIEGVIAGTLAFGCTDAPLTPAQLKALADKGRELIHIPVVLGAVVPIYNLPELGPDKLVFTGPVLADVYLGRITHWDDEAILANNPLLKGKLTHRPIAVTHRSDGSGTTFIWTDYLSSFSPAWGEQVGKGTTVRWPVGKGAAKSEGVTDAVNATVGSIGYVELSHALQLNLRYGFIKNRQGTVIPPTFENVTAAAASLENAIPDDLVFSLVDRKEGKGAETAYPITGATWALLPVPRDGKPDPHVVAFLEWATHEGQQYATDLRYAPLPRNFSDKLDARFYRLKK